MRTLDDALNQFAYHPATPAVAPLYATMRDATMAFTRETWALIPDGPEKTLAYRGLQQFLMHANLAIAMTTPADLTNAAVARVLPVDTDPGRCQHYFHPDAQCELRAGHAGEHRANKTGVEMVW